MTSLKDQIGLNRPFASPEEELYIQLLRTHSAVTQRVNRVYLRANLSHSQYNALRILRGSGDTWLTCDTISGRMVSMDSDLTRILSGLERRGLVERQRAEHDQRSVVNRITQRGKRTLASLDDAVDAIILEVFGVLGKDDINSMITGLARLTTG